MKTLEYWMGCLKLLAEKKAVKRDYNYMIVEAMDWISFEDLTLLKKAVDEQLESEQAPNLIDLKDRIVDWMVKEVQEQSSGFQYIIDYKEIQAKFAEDLEEAFYHDIANSLLKREEVADAIQEVDGFDICLYTSYAPNYDASEYEED